MVCDICGTEGVRIRRIPRTYGKGKDLLVIENIPVISCPHGGSSYLTAETLDRAGLSGQTLTGNAVGTPCFMPRQQVLDYKYAKPEVDVWAAAACLYVMITGYSSRKFQGKNPLLAVLDADAVPVGDRTSAIPQPLATAIDRALVDNPDIYYKNAADFKQALLNS
ncbi:MAG: YgiT-type zinc finger protein [Microcoleus sp.]